MQDSKALTLCHAARSRIAAAHAAVPAAGRTGSVAAAARQGLPGKCSCQGVLEHAERQSEKGLRHVPMQPPVAAGAADDGLPHHSL